MAVSRRDLHALVDRCQVLAGRLPSAASAQLVLELHALSASLPANLSVPEQRVARSVLSQAFGRIVHRAGVQNDPGVAGACVDWERAGFANQEWHQAWSRLADVCSAAIRENDRTDAIRDPFAGRPPKAFVARVLGVIAARFRDPSLNLSAVARDVHCSPWHVARMLTQETGEGFVGHLRRARVAAARRLLVQNVLSMKEIAGAVGYAHPNRLDRDFMRMCGMTPSRFRQRSLVGRPTSAE